MSCELLSIWSRCLSWQQLDVNFQWSRASRMWKQVCNRLQGELPLLYWLSAIFVTHPFWSRSLRTQQINSSTAVSQPCIPIAHYTMVWGHDATKIFHAFFGDRYLVKGSREVILHNIQPGHHIAQDRVDIWPLFVDIISNGGVLSCMTSYIQNC